MSQWVQYKHDKKGTKWRVLTEGWGGWSVESQDQHPSPLLLPKSDYVLCDPPEVWKDVTRECELNEWGAIVHDGIPTVTSKGYRRRKVEGCLRDDFSKAISPGGITYVKSFFIVERKQS